MIGGPHCPCWGLPADGSYSVERDHQSIEASLSVVLPKAIDADLLSEDQARCWGPRGSRCRLGLITEDTMCSISARVIGGGGGCSSSATPY